MINFSSASLVEKGYLDIKQKKVIGTENYYSYNSESISNSDYLYSNVSSALEKYKENSNQYKPIM